MELKYKLNWDLLDWATKKYLLHQEMEESAQEWRKKQATYNVHLPTFTQSQAKIKLTIQWTIPVFATQGGSHVPPESRGYPGLELARWLLLSPKRNVSQTEPLGTLH